MFYFYHSLCLWPVFGICGLVLYLFFARLASRLWKKTPSWSIIFLTALVILMLSVYLLAYVIAPATFRLQTFIAFPYLREAVQNQCNKVISSDEGMYYKESTFGWTSPNHDIQCTIVNGNWRCDC